MRKYNIIRGGIHDLFLASTAKVQMFAGGFGNGKTAAACIKVIQIAKDYPGCNILVARSTYPKLNDTIRKEFYFWCPPEAVARWPTKDDNTLIFHNGSTINFRYIAQRGKQTVDGNTTSNLLSATYDLIVVDQIEDPEITYKDYLDLQGRLRGTTPYKGTDPRMPISGPRFMILTSNPTANWVYKKLVKPYHHFKLTGLVTEDLIHDPNTLQPLMELFEGSTYENKHNLPPDFISTLEANYKGQMRQRFLMGEWAAYEGLVYPTFSPSIHMIPKQHMYKMLEDAVTNKSWFENFEVFDYGMVSPSCYSCGFIDYIGRVFIIDGFYRSRMSLTEIGTEILNLRDHYSEGIEYNNPIWADPAIFRRQVVNGTGKSTDTVHRILSDRYDLYIKPGQNDILAGVAKVTEYLNPREGMHYNPDEKAGPMIYISQELEHAQDEFHAYFWKSSPEGERIDVPKDGNDHFLDGIKYGLSKLPDPSELQVSKPIITPEYLKWQEVPD